jgi:hypothetical protein
MPDRCSEAPSLSGRPAALAAPAPPAIGWGFHCPLPASSTGRPPACRRCVAARRIRLGTPGRDRPRAPPHPRCRAGRCRSASARWRERLRRAHATGALPGCSRKPLPLFLSLSRRGPRRGSRRAARQRVPAEPVAEPEPEPADARLPRRPTARARTRRRPTTDGAVASERGRLTRDGCACRLLGVTVRSPPRRRGRGDGLVAGGGAYEGVRRRIKRDLPGPPPGLCEASRPAGPCGQSG